MKTLEVIQGIPPEINIPAKVWRQRITGSIPRASGAIFNWCATSANATLIPRVIETRFGDGYAQRRPAGINTQDEEWALEFRDRCKAEADAILAFLVARNGVDIFNWTPPRTAKVRSVICPEWSWSYGEMLADRGLTMTVNAKFVETKG